MAFSTTHQNNLWIRAAWIWTGEGLPIPNGCLHIQADRIVSVSTESPANAIDIGAYCILPSLINSHTHLEFSDLPQPVIATNSFADWILSVVQYRRMAVQMRSTDQAQPERIGLTESQTQAVRLALDVVQANVNEATRMQTEAPNSEDIPSSRDSIALPVVVRFAELMGTTELRAKQTWRGALELKRRRLDKKNLFDEPTTLSAGFATFGLSPHAPYTTTSSLIRCAVGRCQRWNAPIMMHLAESRDEMRWIATGDGPLQELLEMVTGPDVLSTRDRLPLAGYVNELCQAPLAFIIHGNYLDEASMSILATNRHHAAVVYCPRTHAHFGHSIYPLMDLKHRGIPVLLGTDSRASNPDLSILAEARLVRKLFRELSAEEIISMITTRPAELLGCSEDYGYIRPGSLHRLTAIASNTTDARDVLDNLLESANPPLPLEAIVKTIIQPNSATLN